MRTLLLIGAWSAATVEAIRAEYDDKSDLTGRFDSPVAVRSSATAEDLSDASFADQQETFLYIVGAEALLAACRKCNMPLFMDRAISYRYAQWLTHSQAALSADAQQMVRADIGGSGVTFSIDTEPAFRTRF